MRINLFSDIKSTNMLKPVKLTINRKKTNLMD